MKADPAPRRPGLRDGLRLLDLPPHRLALPISLTLAAALCGIATLAAWLPLIHLVLTNDLEMSGKYRLVQDLVPDWGKQGMVLFLATCLLTGTALRMICSHIANSRITRLCHEGEAALAEKVIRSHLRFAQGYFDAVHPAGIYRNLKWIPARSSRLVRLLARACSLAALLALLATLMVWLSPILTAACGTLLLLYSTAFRKALARLRRKLQSDEETDEEEDASALHARDLADNLPLLRLHLSEEETIAGYRNKTETLAGQREKRLNTEGLVNDIGEVGATLLMLAFIIGAGWLTEGLQHGDVARYVVFFLVLRRVQRPLAALQRMPQQWDSLRNLLGEADALVQSGGQPRIEGGTRSVPPRPEELRILDLHFAYQEGSPVLNGLNLTAHRGKLHVLHGPNGCGKSTVLKLILRLYDVPPGTILLDGHDLRDFDLAALRRITGYVQSEPLLLNDSLRSNLTIGLERDKASTPSLWQALEDTGLASWARTLEGGLDHEIGDRGMRLSQGQRQKLGLTRTLLRNPGILLLDEAWSSVDADSEADLMPLLVRLAEDRLVVKVTHRVERIPAGAQIFRMDAGRILPAQN